MVLVEVGVHMSFGLGLLSLSQDTRKDSRELYNTSFVIGPQEIRPGQLFETVMEVGGSRFSSLPHSPWWPGKMGPEFHIICMAV